MPKVMVDFSEDQVKRIKSGERIMSTLRMVESAVKDQVSDESMMDPIEPGDFIIGCIGETIETIGFASHTERGGNWFSEDSVQLTGVGVAGFKVYKANFGIWEGKNANGSKMRRSAPLVPRSVDECRSTCKRVRV